MNTKKLFISFIFSICVVSLFSQTPFKKIAFGFGGGSQTEGNNIVVNFENYFNSHHSLTAEMLLFYRFRNVDNKINNTVFALNYNYYFTKIGDFIYPFVSAGAFYGSQKFIDASNDTPHSINKSIYGLKSSLGVELLFNNIGIFIMGSPVMYDFSSSKYFVTGHAGIKFHF